MGLLMWVSIFIILFCLFLGIGLLGWVSLYWSSVVSGIGAGKKEHLNESETWLP